MTDTYVHDGIEVVLTGRKAKKQLRSGDKFDHLVEIKPAALLTASFFKWVRKADLYLIIEDKENGE